MITTKLLVSYLMFQRWYNDSAIIDTMEVNPQRCIVIPEQLRIKKYYGNRSRNHWILDIYSVCYTKK